MSIRCTVVYGGVNISPQVDRLKRGIDVLVATPGRLLDLAEHENLNLSCIEYLIFDEADRMLDIGFHEEISRIIDLVPAQRRTMLFSATYTGQVQKLAEIMLQEPEYIEVTQRNTEAESITQKVHLVDRHNKRALLTHLVNKENWAQILVFVRTKYGVNKLVEKLAGKGISAAALHGNKSQSFRTRTLKEFKNGEIRILVDKVEGYTLDSTVPEFVLLRPDNLFSEKKADKDIKKIIKKRKISKKSSLSRTDKTNGKRRNKKSQQKPRSGRKN